VRSDDRPVVLGTGLTKIGRHWGRSLFSLFSEAARAALDEAGVMPQALYVGNMSAGVLDSQEHLALYLEDNAADFPLVPAFKVESACSSGGSALAAGYAAVMSGLFDAVMVAGVEKLSEEPSASVTSALAMASDSDFEAYYGASFTSLNAMLMRQYMKELSVPREWLSEFAVLMHRNALDNPYAQVRKAITVQEVEESRLIADPIRLLDCSPTGDGAAALIIARQGISGFGSKDPLVQLAGIGVGVDTISLSGRASFSDVPATARAAKAAYSMAGIAPQDVDVAEVHDAFTIMGVLGLEDLGLAKRGEGAKLVHEGQASREGSLPTNPEGGLKARGHPVGATGIYEAVEVVRQLQGKAGKMQVPGAEVGVAQNLGGSGSHAVVSVFRRLKRDDSPKVLEKHRSTLQATRDKVQVVRKRFLSS